MSALKAPKIVGRCEQMFGSKLRAKFNAIFDRSLDFLAWLAIILLVFITLAIGVGVLIRWLSGHSMLWVTEISEHALVYITFLATAWVLKREGHINLETVLERLKPRTQALLNIITSLMGAIMSLAIARYGVQAAWEFYELAHYLATPLRPPTFLLVAVIPLGGVLLFIQFLRRTCHYLEVRSLTK